MTWNSMVQKYRDYVILGLPKAPLAFLSGFCKRYGRRPHLFLLRCPLFLRLFPLAKVHTSASKRWQGVLLMELTDFAEKNAEKQLALIPCSPEAMAFANANREALERGYIITTTEGGLL